MPGTYATTRGINNKTYKYNYNDVNILSNLTSCVLPFHLQITPHDTVFVNELKLSDFKQVLAKNGIGSEFSGGVLWCAQGTIALRRVSG